MDNNIQQKLRMVVEYQLGMIEAIEKAITKEAQN